MNFMRVKFIENFIEQTEPIFLESLTSEHCLELAHLFEFFF